MLRLFFVASLLLVMVLGISEPAVALQAQRASTAHAANPLDAQNCSVYPIAIHTSTLAELLPGASTGDLLNGTAMGNFGWLRWNDDPGSNTAGNVAQELQNPTLSFTAFEEAGPLGDNADHTLNADDWVWAVYGILSSSEMRDTLAGLVDAGTTLRVPVWDNASGSGSSLAYHVQRFVQIRLAGFRFGPSSSYGTGCGPGEGMTCINAVFVGEDPAACPEPADLTIAKSASPDVVWSGQTLTYTLAFSNAGAGLATGVVISDALPLILTDTHFTNAGATITPTTGVTYAWQVQDLTHNEGGIITITGQAKHALSGGLITNSATITGTNTESDTGNNVAAAPVLVSVQPLIFSFNGTTFEVNSYIDVFLEYHVPSYYYDVYLDTRLLCTLMTNGLGIARRSCLIPSDFPPGSAYELWSAEPGGSTKVAGNVFINVTCMACPSLLVKDGNQWPAGSPIVLQLRSHEPYTLYELYFNGTLIGTTNTTDAYGDVNFPWAIPAATPPRESPDSYRFESHAIGSPTAVAHADIYVTTAQIVVQGGNIWPAGSTLRANLRRHAPNHTYGVRCNGVSVGSFTTDSNGQSMSTILCTIPVGAPNSPPYYTITSYDGGILIGQVNVTVSTPVQPYLEIVGGYDWPAGSPIEIQLYHHQASRNYRIYFGAWTANSSLTTDGSGSAQTAYIIPITATQATTYSLRSYDLLTNQTIASHTVTVRAAPLINVTEGAIVQAGSTIHINLSGHAQNAIYDIVLNGITLGSIQTDNNGMATMTYDLTGINMIGGPFILESQLNTTRAAQTSLTIVAAEQIHLPIIFKRG